MPYIFLFLSYNLIKRIGCDETNVCMTQIYFVSVDLLYAWAVSVLSAYMLLCAQIEHWRKRKTHTFQKYCSKFLGETVRNFLGKKIDFHIKRIIKMRITIRSRQFLRMKNWFYNQLIEVNNGRVTFLSQQFILHNLLMTINSIVLCSLSACIRFVHMLLNIWTYTHKSANITKKTNTHTQFAIQWIA